MGDPRGVRVHGDETLADEPAEHVLRITAPGPQFADPDRGAGRRRVVGDVHEPEEQAVRELLLLGGQAVVRGLGGAGQRVPDPAAGQVVGDGQPAATAVFPGREQGMRQQRQRAWLVGALFALFALFAGRLGRRQVAEQQLDQALLHVEAGQPGGLRDRPADLLRGHRPEDHLPGLQRGGQPGIAERMFVEVGAQSQDHQGGLGQVADLGHELAPLGLVLALGKDRLELVHDDDRPRGVAVAVAGGTEVRERGAERIQRRVGRLHQADRAGQARREARAQQ